MPAQPAVAQPAAALSGTPAERAQQQQLQKETSQLLQLVKELKVEVQKAGGDTLSLDALRKADEIQRLSKYLKEKMKERGQALQGKGQ